MFGTVDFCLSKARQTPAAYKQLPRRVLYYYSVRYLNRTSKRKGKKEGKGFGCHGD